MYTQCSSCATLFRVSARHLRAARGRVRCCLCHETFNALPSLTETLPPDLHVDELLARRPRPTAKRSAARLPAGHEQAEHETARPAESPVFAQADAPLPEEELALPQDELSRPEEGPVSSGQEAPLPEEDPPFVSSDEDQDRGRDLFTELELPEVSLPAEPEAPPPQKRRKGGGLLWALGCVGLVALLLLQYGYYLVKRSSTVPASSAEADFVRDPRYRPWFEILCLVARCELPLLRDPGQVHILQRRVTAHATRADALLVKATLVNDANFPQPFPELRLSFLDANGRERASRWFGPVEYLEDPRLRGEVDKGMPPKQPVAVRLELADPGEGAAESFEFDFR